MSNNVELVVVRVEPIRGATAEVLRRCEGLIEVRVGCSEVWLAERDVEPVNGAEKR